MDWTTTPNTQKTYGRERRDSQNKVRQKELTAINIHKENPRARPELAPKFSWLLALLGD
jgi:hypothetical protein